MVVAVFKKKYIKEVKLHRLPSFGLQGMTALMQLDLKIAKVNHQFW